MKTYTKDQVKDLKVLVKTYKSVISNFEKAEVFLNGITFSADLENLTYGELKKAQNRVANLVVCEDFLEGLYLLCNGRMQYLYDFMDGEYKVRHDA